jgi:hypothetical protein
MPEGRGMNDFAEDSEEREFARIHRQTKIHHRIRKQCREKGMELRGFASRRSSLRFMQ